MLPQPFIDRMKEMLGNEYEEFEACFDREKYQALRFNTLKGDKQHFLEKNNLLNLSRKLPEIFAYTTDNIDSFNEAAKDFCNIRFSN